MLVFFDVLMELGFSLSHETFSDVVFRRDFGFHGSPPVRPQDERKLSSIEVHVGTDDVQLDRVQLKWFLEYEKCQIQWIDRRGVPTPDDNAAVAVAVSHQNGTVQRFPICEEHREYLDEMINRGEASWTEEPLPAHVNVAFSFPREWPNIVTELKGLIERAEERARD